MQNTKEEFNNQMIKKHVQKYQLNYRKQTGKNQTSGFSFCAYLASFTTAGCFTLVNHKLADKLLQKEIETFETMLESADYFMKNLA